MPGWILTTAVFALGYLFSSRKSDDSSSTDETTNWDYVFDPKYNPNNT